MALRHCPSCDQSVSQTERQCGVCGYDLGPALDPPIKKISGKFAVIGIVLITIGVIGTALGTLWGPPAILPGVAFYMMAKFF